MGMQNSAVRPVTQMEPMIADWTPARSGRRDGMLVMKSRLNRGPPAQITDMSRMTRNTRPTDRQKSSSRRNAVSLKVERLASRRGLGGAGEAQWR